MAERSDQEFSELLRAGVSAYLKAVDQWEDAYNRYYRMPGYTHSVRTDMASEQREFEVQRRVLESLLPRTGQLFEKYGMANPFRGLMRSSLGEYTPQQRIESAIGRNERNASMLQSLLADRFKLQFHRDTKEVPVYLLVTGKKRLSIKQVKDQGGTGIQLGPNGATFKQTSMIGLAGFLSGLGLIQRPVLDRTSLPGVYDFTLSFSDREAGEGPPLNKRALFAWSSIFEDVQDLGLKLESTKAPVELLVIDHVEKPSAN